MEYLVSVMQDFVESLITLLVILNPINAVLFFCSLTAKASLDERKRIAKRTALVTFLMLLVFAYLGNLILATLHITLESVMIAGGIFLLVFAIKDVTSHVSGAGDPQKTGSLSREEADNIAVFPLSIPLLAGPGAIAMVIVLNNPEYGVAKGLTDFSTPLAILISSIIVWSLFTISTKLTKIVKPSVMMIIGKVMLILMGAVGVSFIVKGITALLSH
jgi:multiple antibiotic resistance protein